MRDIETIETAILAAETGHLVMSTVHTLDATETITRIIAAFPEQRPQARLILAGILKGVISRRLVPRSDGMGMVPAIEVMVSDGAREGVHPAARAYARAADVIARATAPTACRPSTSRWSALARRLHHDSTRRSRGRRTRRLRAQARGINSSSDSRWDVRQG
jgi:twitching motility protein PilT